MTDEQIIKRAKERLKNAFKPFRCVVEDWDYLTKLRFKIFDDNNATILEVPKVPLRDVRDDGALTNLLEQVRERIQSKGFNLI